MFRWMKKTRLVVGAAALLLVLFAASMFPAAGVATIEASTANHAEFIDGSDSQDGPAKRGGRGKGRWSRILETSDDDDDGFDFSGRRYRGD